MTVITSLQNPTVKMIRSLAEKKHRRETGLFVAEGIRAKSSASMNGWEPEYIITTLPPVGWNKARCLMVDQNVLTSLSSQDNPPEPLMVFRQSWKEKVTPEGVWVALEDMRDPGNLGTIIRTADAAGAAGVILVGDCCDPWGPECVRATMGSIFAVPLVKLTRKDLIILAQGWPGEVVGTRMDAVNTYRRSYIQPTLFIMGSEGSGLSSDIAAACSLLVSIPMPGSTESLNVAVAAALLLYQTVEG